jgi:hypothetical protein
MRARPSQKTWVVQGFFWHSVASLGIILRIYLVSSRIIQRDLNYSECWDVKSGREHVPVLACRVFIGGTSTAEEFCGALHGSFHLLGTIGPTIPRDRTASPMSIVCSVLISCWMRFCRLGKAKKWCRTFLWCDNMLFRMGSSSPWHRRLPCSNGRPNWSVNIHYCDMWGKVSCQKLDILETSEFFWEEVNLVRGAVKCARFCSSSLIVALIWVNREYRAFKKWLAVHQSVYPRFSTR